MDKNASSADDPRDGVIDVERLEESWWPPAAHSFPTPRGLNGSDWRNLRTVAGELGPGEPADGEAVTAVAEALGDPGPSAPPRRVGWVAAIVPLVVVGGVIGLVIGGGSDDASRSALGGPATSAATTVASAAVTTSVATTTSSAASTSAAPTTVATAAATTAPAAGTTAATSAATTAPATTAAPGTTAVATTTATTASSPPVTLASPGDAKALDDLDLAGLNWWGELRDGSIFLRGRIASVAQRELVIANVKARAGDARVVEQLVVDASITGTRPIGDVPLFVTDRVYFTGTSAAIDSSYQNLMGFARFTLFSEQGVTLSVVVRTPDDTEGTSLARARADAVVEAVVGDVIDPTRVSVSTGPALGDEAGNDELARRDRAVLLVFYGIFASAPAA